MLMIHYYYGLQILVDICERECDSLDMQINVNKSCCVRFGNRFNEQCSEIISKHGGADSCRYLDINFVSSRFFRCFLDESKSCFFCAFNAVYSKVGHFASDPVLLGLIRAKCMPILFYGIESCPQINSVEFSLTRIFMRIFCTNSPVIVKQRHVNFGIQPIACQLKIRTARFLQKFIGSQNMQCLLFKHYVTSELIEKAHSAAQLHNVITELCR
jgi:hypothetical protein